MTTTRDILNDPVTQHMRTDAATLRMGQTVEQALASLRAAPPPGRVVYFYVVDENDRLQGVVPTRRLLLNPLEQRIDDLLVRPVIALPQQATVLDACEFFTLHRLLAFPVVDDQRRLLGVVDVDLYTDELRDLERREDHDDLFQLIGVYLPRGPEVTPLQSFRQRFPWLLCNIAGGLLAAFLSGLFEEQLQRVVALALFIPVVLALAESVSIQSVSLALDALHRGRPTWRVLFLRLYREGQTGGMLGICCGLLVAGVALIWLEQWRVSACLLGGVTGGVLFAAMVGLSTPMLLRLLRANPQVAAGPIALATADMLTLGLYFNLARWLL